MFIAKRIFRFIEIQSDKNFIREQKYLNAFERMSIPKS